jgi:UDP-N-acetylglucosamine:LPS N-acetylglucosamine transferase
MATPVVAAVDMGYGHLRPAAALADQLGTQVMQIELPPLGDRRDQDFWRRVRKMYEPLTRLSQAPTVGAPMRTLLNALTAIPSPWPARDLSAATAGTRWMERVAKDGIGEALAEYVKAAQAPLMTTFYAAAILAELHGASRLHCLVTDSDVNRVWAPPQPRKSGIRYFTPAERARRRMVSYGVPKERVRSTGYPLPDELVGRDGAALRRNFEARAARLSRKGSPPLIVFAIGGAGAQVPLAKKLIRGMAPQVRDGSLRLALVAGRRPEVASALNAALEAARIEAELLYDPDVFAYIRRFNALLASADALWSKPSEMTFFAALGLPFISAAPVGVHEQWNLRWAADRGAALPQHEPESSGEWLLEWLEDGVLLSAAEAGLRLPSRGLYEICDELDQA